MPGRQEYISWFIFMRSVNRDEYLSKYKYAIAKAEILAPEIPEINFAKSSYLVTVEG